MKRIAILFLVIIFFVIVYLEPWFFGLGLLVLLVISRIKEKYTTGKTEVNKNRFEGFVNIERTVKNTYPEIDFEILKEELLIIYKNIYSRLNENSTNNLNYLVTENMFTDYTNWVTTNSLKKETEIVKDMSFSDCYILNFKMLTDGYLISLVVDVTAFYYTFDEINDKVLSGNNEEKETRRFKLTFMSRDNEKEVCYNCFKDINVNELGACSNCGVNLSGFGGMWLLSEEKHILSNEVFYEKEN